MTLRLLTKECSKGEHHMCPRWFGKLVMCDCRCGHG